MSERREPWKKRLGPFAYLYLDFESAIEEKLKEDSDADLKSLMEAAEKTTATNCWWAIYRVAPFVREEAARLLLARDRQRKEPVS